MTDQLGFSFDGPADNEPDYDPRAVCTHGTYILSPCRQCEEETDRLCAAFAVDVAAGKYDAEGYTPNERRAQRKRQESRADD